jgi:hypothetical protein
MKHRLNTDEKEQILLRPKQVNRQRQATQSQAKVSHRRPRPFAPVTLSGFQIHSQNWQKKQKRDTSQKSNHQFAGDSMQIPRWANVAISPWKIEGVSLPTKPSVNKNSQSRTSI